MLSSFLNPKVDVLRVTVGCIEEEKYLAFSKTYPCQNRSPVFPFVFPPIRSHARTVSLYTFAFQGNDSGD